MVRVVNTNKRVRRFSSASVMALSVAAATAIPSGVAAQEADEEETTDQVVVTGSRIARDGFSMTQPTMVTGQDDVTVRGFDNIASALNDIPSFGIPDSDITGSTSNAKFSEGEPIGQQFVNLFGLGSQRTLVVIDGKRMVSQSTPGFSGGGQQIDLNIIPVLAIDRIETVTVSGSPIYGSDAIAGTVNIILRDDFEGAEFDARYGVTNEGDGQTYQAGGIVGARTPDDRGSMMLTMQYTDIREIHPWSEARPESASEARFINNSRAFVRDPDVIAEFFPNNEPVALCPRNCGDFFFFTNGGVPMLAGQDRDGNLRVPFGRGPGNDLSPFPNAQGFNQYPTAILDAQGRQLSFAPDSTLQPFDPGEQVDTIYSRPTAGLSGAFEQPPSEFETVQLQSGQERINFLGSADYELADWITFKAEAIFAYSDTLARAQPSNNSAFFGFDEIPAPIRLDNPFLPDSARSVIASNADLDGDGIPENMIDTTGDGVFDQPGFYVARFHNDIEDFGKARLEQFVYSARTGFEGAFDLGGRDINWDLTYTFGRTEQFTRADSINDDNFFRALDAVQIDSDQAEVVNDFFSQAAFGSGLPQVSGGDVICRQQLDAALSGRVPGLPGAPGVVDNDFATRVLAECRPLNILGDGAPSQEAIDYVTVNFNDRSILEQHDVIGIVSLDAFDLPYNNAPVGFAGGFEYRRELAEFNEGGINEVAAGRVPPTRSVNGDFNILEGFAEVLVPAVTPDMEIPLVQSLQLEAAARFIDNSTSGSAWTYTGGGQWQMFDDVMFRGNYTRSVRAPSAGEVFQPIGGVRDPITDPCGNNLIDGGGNPAVRRANCEAAFAALEAERGAPFDFTLAEFIREGATGPQLVSGNPNLTNEVANSYTIGAVITPSQLPGLQLSVDYVDISITDLISFLDSNAIPAACFDDPSFTNFCDNFTRDPDTFQINDGVLQTFANIGYRDFSAIMVSGNYQGSMDDFGLDGWGDFQLSANYQYLDTLETSLLGTGDDLDIDAGEFSNPEHQLRGALTYFWEDFSFFWQTSWVSSTVPLLQDPLLERFDIPGSTISNLAVSYNLQDNLFFRLSVNNVMNRYPTALEQAAREVVGRGNTTPITVDPLGRRFVFSVNARF